MADTPIFARNTAPGTTVTLPGFEKSRQLNQGVAFLELEGFSKPRGFRSPGRYESWTITAIFGPSPTDRALAVTFMAMIDAAQEATDARFIMKPGGLQTAYTDRLVELSPYVEDIVPVSGITRVTFTATEVEA